MKAFTSTGAPTVRRRERMDRYVPLVYDQLRRIARRYLDREASDHTLQPTALVHEAYLHLAERGGGPWNGKTHFLAIAAREMRRVLVDHARATHAAKRGGGLRPVTLAEDRAATPDLTVDVLILDQALCRLAAASGRQARVVEMRVFAGMTVPEIAAHLGCSQRTIHTDWRTGKAWLTREMRPRIAR